MKHILFFVLTIMVFTTATFAQQDPMFTKYMFNGLVYNPAYAGAKDHLAATVIHRDQWLGVEGAPTTQTFTIHTPLNDPKVGVGFSFYNDKIGPLNQMNASGSYAYRIIFNQGKENESKLAFGLQASYMNWRSDFSQLLIQNPDQAFMDTPPNQDIFNFGAGVLYYTRLWYLGLSVPRFRNHVFRTGGAITAQQVRHYFLAGGLAIPMNQTEDLIFKPSFTIKNSNLFGAGTRAGSFVSGIDAPTEFDIDISFLFFKTLWVGASFRSSIEALTSDDSSTDSVDLWAAFYLRNGFRIGVAYDYTISNNDFRKLNDGSYELMLSYELNFSEGTIVTPRYF